MASLWEYKVEKATFGNDLEAKLNHWGLRGWEVITMAGLNGTMTLTGNKIFVVMKREHDSHAEAGSQTEAYEAVLEPHFGPNALRAALAEHGPRAVEDAVTAYARCGTYHPDPVAVIGAAAKWIAMGRDPDDMVRYYLDQSQPA